MSEIQKLYQDASVLLSGGSGFLGKIILSKLFTSCPGVKRVYLLMRPRKGVSAEDRLTQMLNKEILKKVEEQVPDMRQRITVVSGECCVPDLGLSKDDRALLIENVNIVIHSAATIRFNENLKMAINTNVLGTKSMVHLAKEVKNLKAFVHISTAYSNCHMKTIDEKFYEFDTDYDDLIRLAKVQDEEYMDTITPKILGKWPNTYVFTKAAAEQVILKEGKGLPITILRPSIVLSTNKEPLPGWTDENVYGPMGFVAGGATGCMKVTRCNKQCISDLVPADSVVNGVIAASWKVNKLYEEKQMTGEESIPEIYNFVSGNRNPLTWSEYTNIMLSEIQKQGVESAIMYPDTVYLCSNYLVYRILAFIFHSVPIFLIDLYFKCIGKKIRLSRQYERISAIADVIGYFACHQWRMLDNNVGKLWESLNSVDKATFPFDITQLDWNQYLALHLEGIKRYILKESMDPKKAMTRLRVCYRYHILMKTVFYSVMALLTIFIFNRISILKAF